VSRVSECADKIDLLFEYGLVTEIKESGPCACYGCTRIAEIEAKCPRCFNGLRRSGICAKEANRMAGAFNRFRVCWGCLASHVYRSLPLVCPSCMGKPVAPMVPAIWKPSWEGCEASPWQENAIRAYEDAG
jgi:hypothetical protein